MSYAVAVDFGATSGRFALGCLKDGLISVEIVEQISHSPKSVKGRLEWDLDLLLGMCRRAADFAQSRGAASLGIDSWGVDHGFLNQSGELMGAPVCYRDHSHEAAFKALEPFRTELYGLTGIQHQPFNTICQLAARLLEDSEIANIAKDWMILPDLLGYLLTGERNHELTQASTTQLLGLNREWSGRAFEIAGWPTPDRRVSLPGGLGGLIREGVRIAHVGSHDTASAVAGFGTLAGDQIFLNVGTWSLMGAVIDEPIATPQAEAANFTNERTVDGRVRFLKNVPGFYIINRIHEELNVNESVPQWLGHGQWDGETVDLLHADFFNPDSMIETCRRFTSQAPTKNSEWAGFAMASLTRTLANLPVELSKFTGKTYTSIRVGGGGSQSSLFCSSLARTSGLKVIAGPAEATVLGNLGMQLLASGEIASREQMERIVSASSMTRLFEP